MQKYRKDLKLQYMRQLYAARPSDIRKFFLYAL